MKKVILCLMATILSLTIIPVQSFASDKVNPVEAALPVAHETKESAEAKALLLRLDEIKAIDKSKLNSNEKKSLRKEVRSINRKLKDISGGVYISAGALIVILLLLILLT